MSVDYRIKICRKVDNKVLGICNANQLKNIMDSDFDKMIHCDGRQCNKIRFEPDDLDKISAKALDDIKLTYASIFEKKMMIALAKNEDIKHSLENDILYLEEHMNDISWIIWSANVLTGMIMCVVEDLWDENDEHVACEYNGSDLSHANEDQVSSNYVLVNDVYCEIEECF